jgi:ABC-type uncharacterized transport system ATPase subunit
MSHSSNNALAEVHGKTILISSHQLSEIEQIADIIGILHDGAYSLRISAIPIGSKPFVGSSKINNSGSFIKALAIPRRLDPIGIAEIRKLLKELAEVHGKTILISSHQLSER